MGLGELPRVPRRDRKAGTRHRRGQPDRPRHGSRVRDGRARRAQRAGDARGHRGDGSHSCRRRRGRRARLLDVAHPRPPRHGRRAGSRHLSPQRTSCSASAGRWPRVGRRSSSWPRRGSPARTSSRRRRNWSGCSASAPRSTGPISFGMIQVDAGARPLARTTRHLGGRARGGQSAVPADRRATVRHAVRLPRPSRVHPSSDLPPPEGRVQPRGAGARGSPIPPCKAAILAEDDLPPDPNVLFDNMFALVAVLARPALRPGRPARLRADPRPDRRRRSPPSAARTRWPRCTT